MNSYVTLDQYRKRLDRFFDQLYPAPVEGAAQVADPEQDLSDAAAEIDARAAVRYQVPLPAGLPLVVNWTMTLAEELAWSRDTRQKLPDNVSERCKVVRKQLDDLAAGRLVLPGDVPESLQGVAAAVIAECDPPVFNRESMRGY